jgi:CBS domain-containing protein
MSGGAVKLLINAGASILPVVNDKGDVVGVLSEYDIIQHMLEGEGAFDLQAISRRMVPCPRSMRGRWPVRCRV